MEGLQPAFEARSTSSRIPGDSARAPAPSRCYVLFLSARNHHIESLAPRPGPHTQQRGDGCQSPPPRDVAF